jgi:hypothetical protein
MAEIEGFDIDRSIAQAWAEFAARLGEVLSMVDESGDLTIGTGPADGTPDSYLRFSSPTRDRVRCVAGLDPDPGQGEGQLEALLALGWRPTPGTEPPNGGPPGPTLLCVERPQDDSDALAELAVQVLRDVFGVQHPVFLAPDELAEVLQPNPAPIEGAAVDHRAGEPQTPTTGGLGSALEPVAGRGRGAPVEVDPEDLDATLPQSASHLSQLVDDELTSMYGHPPFRDTEGDVAIRVGSTMLFLRTSSDGKEVVVFAAVVHDVSGRSRAAEVINDLNVESRWVKFQLIRDRVFASISVLAQPFVPAHLHQAVRVLSDVADGIDEELASKLDGRTTFNGPD